MLRLQILCSLLLPFASCQKINVENPITVKALPEDAAIVFHKNGFIYSMDRTGAKVVQLTFGNSHAWEHVAVSPDHRFIVGNEQLPNPEKAPGGHSRLWVYDLALGTETKLLHSFITAGNGGVDWDRDGYIYFGGKEKDPFQTPMNATESLANAGANDIYRVKPDGTSLYRVVQTPDQGESDVSVSEDGKLLAYGNQILSNSSSEIWIAAIDGSFSKRVYRGGTLPDGQVADPELSPTNDYVVFSQVNKNVPPNFPDNPDANTAHDIFTIKTDGTELIRLTVPGPISIVPDWIQDDILYLSISEKDQVASTALIKSNKTDQQPLRLLLGTNIAKWIP